VAADFFHPRPNPRPRRPALKQQRQQPDSSISNLILDPAGKQQRRPPDSHIPDLLLDPALQQQRRWLDSIVHDLLLKPTFSFDSGSG
jgi:hypothetical protein